MSGIFDSEIHFVRVANFASEFDLLGTSIYAHLAALPSVFSRRDLRSTQPTLRGIGRLYRNPRKMTGYANALVGKAFEYAVADLFNNLMEPYYSLICQGIDSAVSTHVSDRVTRAGIDVNGLSCVRVAKECSDAEAMLAEFGRFRMLRDARRSLENAARSYPGLEDKVDVIFCERYADPAYRFAVLTSLKSNPDALAPSNAGQDFQTYPLDLAITIETARRREVRFIPALGASVVHLPLNVDAGVYGLGEREPNCRQSAARRREECLPEILPELFPARHPPTLLGGISRKQAADGFEPRGPGSQRDPARHADGTHFQRPRAPRHRTRCRPRPGLRCSGLRTRPRYGCRPQNIQYATPDAGWLRPDGTRSPGRSGKIRWQSRS